MQSFQSPSNSLVFSASNNLTSSVECPPTPGRKHYRSSKYVVDSAVIEDFLMFLPASKSLIHDRNNKRNNGEELSAHEKKEEEASWFSEFERLAMAAPTRSSASSSSKKLQARPIYGTRNMTEHQIIETTMLPSLPLNFNEMPSLPFDFSLSSNRNDIKNKAEAEEELPPMPSVGKTSASTQPSVNKPPPVASASQPKLPSFRRSGLAQTRRVNNNRQICFVARSA